MALLPNSTKSNDRHSNALFNITQNGIKSKWEAWYFANGQNGQKKFRPKQPDQNRLNQKNWSRCPSTFNVSCDALDSIRFKWKQMWSDKIICKIRKDSLFLTWRVLFLFCSLSRVLVVLYRGIIRITNFCANQASKNFLLWNCLRLRIDFSIQNLSSAPNFLFSGRVRLTTNLEFIFNGCSASSWHDCIEEFPALKLQHFASVSFNHIQWFMVLFCFRLFCSPSAVASISEVINSAPLRLLVKSSIVQAALFVVRHCLSPFLASIGEVIDSAPLRP
jgi:hypothetical protein